MTYVIKISLAMVNAVVAISQTPIPQQVKSVYLQSAIEAGAKGDLFTKLKANSRAQELRLPEPFQMDESTILREMGRLATIKDPRALLYLGQRDYHKSADPDTKLRGKELIKQAADLGYAEAQDKLAKILKRNSQDAEESRYWQAKAVDGFEARANKGDTEAMYWLGLNHGGPTNLNPVPVRPSQNPEYWLRMAAEKGHIPAASVLGWLLTDSEKRTEDEQREAWRWLHVAADAGEPLSMIRIGREYAVKEGRVISKFIPYDPAMAWQWWDKAIARMGKQEVMESLEDLKLSGNLPPRPDGRPPF